MGAIGGRESLMDEGRGGGKVVADPSRREHNDEMG